MNASPLNGVQVCSSLIHLLARVCGQKSAELLSDRRRVMMNGELISETQRAARHISDPAQRAAGRWRHLSQARFSSPLSPSSRRFCRAFMSVAILVFLRTYHTTWAEEPSFLAAISVHRSHFARRCLQHNPRWHTLLLWAGLHKFKGISQKESPKLQQWQISPSHAHRFCSVCATATEAGERRAAFREDLGSFSFRARGSVGLCRNACFPPATRLLDSSVNA